MLINILKTLPRDFRFVSRHLKSLRQLKEIEKRNGSVGKVFDEYALRNPEKIALYFQDEKWSFRQVYEKSNKIGNLFAESGLKKSDVVCLFMENRPEYICTWLGLSKIGVVTALVNFNLRSEPLKHSFNLANGKAIICGYELADALNDIYPRNSLNIPVYGTGKGDRSPLKSAVDLDHEIHRVSSDPPPQQQNSGFLDELFYLYTSGTTGMPKAAVVKHARFLMAGIAGRNANKIREDDIIYSTLPLYHTNSGILGASQMLICGSTMALRDKFSAKNFWKDCIKYNATAAQYMGETMRYLLRQPPSQEETQHKVRLMFGNGLRQEIWTEFVTRFRIKEVSEIYGATEGNVSIVNNTNSQVGSCGFAPLLLKKLFPLVILRLDENGEPIRDLNTGLLTRCKVGEIGELVGKIEKNHPFRDFKGYASNKSANEKKILRDVFKKGDTVFRTGDLFVQDELGYFYFKDRMGEAYRWKGENVSTTEVEYVISNLTPKKLDVVAFPVKIPNTDGLAGMIAIADDENALDLKSLTDKMKKSLPSYAIPMFVRVVKEIEITGTHKMKKSQLMSDGYNINLTKSDKVYLWMGGAYVPLTEELYERISSGLMDL